MKNAMQLKAIIKKSCKRKAHIRAACNAEFYVGEIVGTNIDIKISTEFYFEGRFFDCGNSRS